MDEKRIILITGANSGIGLELASQLLSDQSSHILLGCRSAEKGKAALEELLLKKLPGTVELLIVDVNSDESIKTAAKLVETKYGRLDVLVNNAGIGTPKGSLAVQMSQILQTNATGPLLMVEAFAPLLKKSIGAPYIVNVTSGAGSITRRSDPKGKFYNQGAVPYRTSKAALNMITACQEAEFAKQGFKVFLYSPGYCVSNLSPHNKLEFGAQPTSDGVVPIVKILNGERDEEHGKFLHMNEQFPW